MSRRPPGEDDVVLARAGSGTIHLGIPLGRGVDAMCCQMLESPVLRTWNAGSIPTAEQYALEKADYLCEECLQVGEKPWATICRITGWA